MIYFIVFFVLLLVIFLSETVRTSKLNRNRLRCSCGVLLAIILILLAGLRYNNWTDWDMYYNYFKKGTNTSNDIEIGYKYWNLVVFSFIQNYNVFLLLSYGVLLSIFYKVSKGFAGNAFLFSFVVLYSCYFLSSGGFRQFIAEQLFVLSFYLYSQRRFFVCTTVLVIAFLFHRTIILVLPFLLLLKINFGLKSFLLLVCFCAVLQLSNFFVTLLDIALPQVNLLEIDSLSTRMNLYSKRDLDMSLLSFGFMRKFLFCIFYIYISQKRDNQDNIYRQLVNLYIIGLLLSMVLPGEFNRFSIYFLYFECFILPISFSALPKNISRRVKYIISIILFIAFSNRLLSSDPHLYFPYNCVLSSSLVPL